MIIFLGREPSLELLRASTKVSCLPHGLLMLLKEIIGKVGRKRPTSIFSTTAAAEPNWSIDPLPAARSGVHPARTGIIEATRQANPAGDKPCPALSISG